MCVFVLVRSIGCLSCLFFALAAQAKATEGDQVINYKFLANIKVNALKFWLESFECLR